jgi:glycosyltransferase involved in cell wall biosynthesis
MTENRVSIVIPAYNAEPFIERSVRSVLDQTYVDIEVIAVDDGSIDATYSLLKKMSDTDSRLIVMRNSANLGVSGATNRGIGLSSGEFLAFHDHDDIMLPHKVQKCVKTLASNRDCLGVISTGLYIDENYVSLGKTSSVPEYIRQSPYFVRAFERSYVQTWAMFLRKSFLNGYLFDELITEGNQDTDFFLRLLYLKKRFLYIDEPLILFRQSGGSLSKKATNSFKIYAKHKCDDIEDLYGYAGYNDRITNYAKGIIYIHKEEYAEAIYYFLESLRCAKKGDFPIIMFMLASAYFKANNYSKSLDALQTVNQYIHISEVLNNIGVCKYIITGNDSHEDFKKALDIFPGYQDAIKNMNSEVKYYTIFPLRKVYTQVREVDALKELI